MADKEMELYLKEREHKNGVQQFLALCLENTFLVTGRIDPDENYNELTGWSTGYFEIELALNRNTIKLPYRTNGLVIETKIGEAWLELAVSNIFSIIVAYMLLNIQDICAPD